jgi:Flp pilus assembly CpaE family ATPase
MYPLKVVIVGCDSTVAAQVQQALAQRGAIIDTVLPDLAGVAEGLHRQAAEPRLFVVHIPSTEALKELKHLTGTLVGHPVIALVPATAGPALLLGAMRAGAVQVVPLPWSGGDFIEALDCVALQQGHGERNGQVIAVSGVLGGCGATTLAVNLSHEITRRPKTTCLLLEMAFQVGTIATTLDLDPPLTTYDLLSDPERLDIHGVRQAITSMPGSFDVIVAPFRDIRPAAVPLERVLRLIRFARRLASVVVLDLPCTFDEVYFETPATVCTPTSTT